MDEKIVAVLNEMSEYLSISQMKFDLIYRNIKKKANVRTLQLIIFVEIYPASFPGWRKRIIF